MTFSGFGAAVPSTLAWVLAVTMGTTWPLASACMACGMGVPKLPVSVIAPLTNSNALVAVLVAWRRLT
jgi:transporter family protein